MRLGKSLLGKTALASAILGGFLLLVGTPGAKAQSWDDCNRRTTYSNFQLHEAIEHYGYFSPQARYWRRQQHEAYEQVERYQRNEARQRARREHERREHHRDRDRWDNNR
jgi:hypothetical protein